MTTASHSPMDESRRELEAVERRVLLRRYEADGDESVFDEALRRYEAALAAGEGGVELLHELGYLWESRGVFALRRAVELYERAVAADPEAAEPRHQLIQARSRLLDAGRSLEEYRAGVAAWPDDVAQRRFLVQACLAARAYDEAAEVLREALDRFPDDAALVAADAALLEATGRVEDALPRYERAAELAPEDASPLFGRALALTRLGRRDEAVAAWRALIAWLDSRGFGIEAEWPRRELARLVAEQHP